jgi:hypothetical protein
MATNIWGAGQDALLGFLADRDAKKHLAEDRARRDRLDQETAQDRALMRETQRMSAESLVQDRADRTADRRTATETAARNQQEIDAALAVMAAAQANPEAHSPEEVTRAATVLDKHKVSPNALNSLKPKPPTGRSMEDELALINARAAAGARYRAPRPDGSAPRVPTPAQINAARAQAQRIARQDEREARIPEGMDLKQYEDQLFRESLMAMGAELPPAPDFGNVQSGASSTADPQAAPPAVAGPGPQMEPGSLEAKAEAVLSRVLGRPATPEDIAKFLNDPQNIAELQRQP